MMTATSKRCDSIGEISFDQYAVAFLDILGFKEFMRKVELPGTDEFRAFCELQAIVRKQLTFISGDGRQQHLFPADVQLALLHISDSFVLSAPMKPGGRPGHSGLVAVAIKAIQLAHQLLKMGFLLRGGVAVGPVYRTTNNIFGTGYQDAFETESKLARMPRVLLHKSAVAALESGVHSGFPLRLLSIFMKEVDDYILDTLNSHWSYISDNRDCDVSGIFNAYKIKIEKALLELPAGEPREKWKWMAALFDAKCQSSNDLRSIGAIQTNKLGFLFGQNDNENTTFKKAFGPFMRPSKRYIINGH